MRDGFSWSISFLETRPPQAARFLTHSALYLTTNMTLDRGFPYVCAILSTRPSIIELTSKSRRRTKAVQVNSELRERPTCQICPNAGVKCHAEGASLSITDSGHTKTPDFSIPVPGATHHDAPVQHDEEAARHRQQAAELYQCGRHEKVSHHAHLAYAHHLEAERHAAEAAKAHMKSSQRFSSKPL